MLVSGNPFTVKFAVATFEQLLPVMLYEIIVVPALTAVTKPFASIVATEGLLEDQVPPEVAFANCEVPPRHTAVVPVIAATVGGAINAILTELEEVPQAFVAVKESVTDPFAKSAGVG